MAIMTLTTENTATHFSLLTLSGKDGRRFLQGQLSCDMDKLHEGMMMRGALCNLKGRVAASMWIWLQDDVIYLRSGSGMGEIIANTLNKYMVFFDCELTDVSEQYQLWQTAAAGPYASDQPDTEQSRAINTVQVDGANAAVCLDQTSEFGRRYELFVRKQSDASTLLSALPDTLRPLSATDWAIASTELGWVMIHPAISEKYTPQLLNYDLDGTVNFKKGCYTGQEVIARMYYRAEAKQRLYRLKRPLDSSASDFGITKEDNIVFSVTSNEKQVIELVIAPTDDSRRHSDIETITMDA